MNDDTKKVFISYSHKDKEFAERIESNLRNKGVDTWFDKFDILPGDSIVQKIFSEGLKNCDAFIILLSSESVKSSWVNTELDVAMIKRIEELTKIIPIIIEKCEVPMALKPLMHIDLTTGDYEQKFRELIKGINGHYEKPPLGAPPDYIKDRSTRIKSLSPEATLLGKALIEADRSHGGFEGSYWAKDLAEALKYTPQEIDDAIEELEGIGLVKTQNYLGTAPYRHGHVFSMYALYLYFSKFALDYSPEEDIKIVAASIASVDGASGEMLKEMTKLEIPRLNRAVEYLEDYGIIQTIKSLGTAPYMFDTVISTSATRRFVREKCK